MKTAIKTESMAEFIARGGKINKVAMNVGKRSYKKAEPNKIVAEAEIDMSVLPEALKIKYGVK